jgi:micrococcal nuclease
MPVSPRSQPVAVLLLTLVAVLGCSAERQSRSILPQEASVSPTPYVRAGLTPATVTRVVDGDTIRVEVEGQEFRLRYIGIDTPETVDPRRPVQCFGQEASERNKQLVEGQVVGLEKDVSETDSFGRLLRYVWLGDQMINATLVEEGYALASTYPPDVRYAEHFATLQTQSRANQRGLWGDACAGAASPTRD